MKSVIHKFILLSYGKVYGSLLQKKSSRDVANFSAITQLSLLITLNFLAVVFVLMTVFEGTSLKVIFFDFNRVAFLQVLTCVGGGLIFLWVGITARKYSGEYENISNTEDFYLKKYVDLYPYLVAIFLVVSIFLYTK